MLPSPTCSGACRDFAYTMIAIANNNTAGSLMENVSRQAISWAMCGCICQLLVSVAGTDIPDVAVLFY